MDDLVKQYMIKHHCSEEVAREKVKEACVAILGFEILLK
jgi:hypothetical protein